MSPSARLRLLAALVGIATLGCGGSISASDDATGGRDAPTASSAGLSTLTVPPLQIQSMRVDPFTLIDVGATVDTEIGPCSVTVGDADALDRAVAAAEPGSVICVIGTHRGHLLRLDRSGTAEAPVVIAGQAAEIGALEVAADHVVITGLALTGAGDGRPGVRLAGADIVVDDLTVIEPGGHGIVCGLDDDPCRRVTIADSVISGADGTGIMIFDADVTVSGNEVAGSRRIKAGDADGIRFFGARHRITANLVHSIYDRGYEGEGPHTDCFQTFDNAKSPTVDVVVEGNVCVDVDHQCLIASAEESYLAGDVGRSSGLVFRNNVCASNGSQAVFVRHLPGSVIANNLFLDTNRFQTVVLQEAATSARVVNNIFLGPVEPYLIDDESAVDTVIDHNLHLVTGSAPVTEPNAVVGVDPLFTFDAVTPLRPAPGSPLIDAGIDLGDGLLGLRDLGGHERILDGDGDTSAAPDIGPSERP